MNKENWLIASLGIHFSSISIGPHIVDLLASVLASLEVKSSTDLYESEITEERPSELQASSFFEDEASHHVPSNDSTVLAL